MKILVFGNPDVGIDSLPLRILPQLRSLCPNIEFEVRDPNEEWDDPEELVVLDTLIGVKEVTVFEDLDKFTSPPRVSMHDFDALTNLRLMKKLGKIKKVTVIGLPLYLSRSDLDKTAKIIREMSK